MNVIIIERDSKNVSVLHVRIDTRSDIFPQGILDDPTVPAQATCLPLKKDSY